MGAYHYLYEINSRLFIVTGRRSLLAGRRAEIGAIAPLIGDRRTCRFREPDSTWRPCVAGPPTPPAAGVQGPHYADARQHRIAIAFDDQQQCPDCYLPFQPILRHLRKRLDEVPGLAKAAQRPAIEQLDGIKE
jgi:hypothetical protein